MNRAPVDVKVLLRQLKVAETARGIELGRTRDAAEVLADAASGLALAEGRKATELRKAATSLRGAMHSHPDNPDRWIAVGPFVVEESGHTTSLLEMLLSPPDPEDPRRLASVLLRALDWRLPR